MVKRYNDNYKESINDQSRYKYRKLEHILSVFTNPSICLSHEDMTTVLYLANCPQPVARLRDTGSSPWNNDDPEPKVVIESTCNSKLYVMRFSLIRQIK
jgi:hypothetical protein